jgi:hypothetical protein
MNTFTQSMFDNLKTALEKNNSGGSSYKDIMRFEKNKTYTVRLLPNIKDAAKTFFHYYSYAWESFSTGQYITNVSPTTFGDRDPIGEYKFRISKHGTPAEKEKGEKIMRRESWLVNAYVIDDPTNPANNGSIKLMRFGRQLNKIIMDAINGDDADQFGSKIFDLSDEGCNLRVKVDVQGDFPTYVSSKFLMPCAVQGLDGDPNDVYNNTIDLESIYRIKSYDELEEVLNEHFHGVVGGVTNNQAAVPNTPVVESVTTKDSEDDDDIPFDSSSSSTDSDLLDDDKVKELLAGLDE